MKTLYYALWNIVLIFPEAFRILLGVLLIALCIYIMWPIEKYIFAGVLRACVGLNYLILGCARYILPRLHRGKKYVWDEKIGNCGKRNNVQLHEKGLKILKSTRKEIFCKKNVWFVLFCLYILAILPSFQLENYIPEHYVSHLYRINQTFMNAEEKLISGIEEYPPFWIVEESEEEKEEVVGEVMEEVMKQPICLKLNDETSFANIREAADMSSNSICVVSKEDELLYQYIYNYDTERFWLRVTLPDYNNLEGWISANVIEPEIVNTLDLQYEGQE